MVSQTKSRKIPTRKILPPFFMIRDYGEPTGLCAETAHGSLVFTRDWTRATVEMDCNSWTPSITMK